MKIHIRHLSQLPPKERRSKKCPQDCLRIPWKLPAFKCLYADAPSGTTYEQLQTYVLDMVNEYLSAGIIREFNCIFLPHLEVGDTITMDGQAIGVIKTVNHIIGNTGFITNIVTDSAGRYKHGRSIITEIVKR